MTKLLRRSLVVTSAALAVAAFAAYGKFRHDLELEIARVSTGSELALTACGPIEYASVGEGPVVLLVHGAGGGFDQPVEMARELAAHGLRVVMPSRFGYLRTPLPADASPQAQADAHACLLDALKIRRAAVMGISAGGPSAMQFALRHPQRASALVLLVPLAYAPREPAPPPSPGAMYMIQHAVKSDFLYWAAMTVYPDLVIGTILGTPPEVVARARQAEQARVTDLMHHILPLSRRQQGLLNEARIAASLERFELEKIAARTLVVSVEDDRYGTYPSARYTASQIPNARFVGYADGGHLFVGRGAQVMAEIAAFLVGSTTLGLAR
jgi:2-hydroxy-6-oxonona-2,4-dienedioate hydrolase